MFITLGLAFWIGLAIDWTFEPSITTRQIAWTAVLSVAAWLSFRFIVRRTFVKLANTHLAVILERYFPQFEDSLATAIEMAERPVHAEPYNAEMLDHTRRDAVARAQDIDLRDVFDWRPLRRSAVLATMLACSIVGLAVMSRDTFGFWIQRMSLIEEGWPRTTRLVVEGFPHDDDGVRRVKVARDAPLELMVKADTSKPHIPETVELRYRLDDRSRGRDAMTRIGRANPARDAFQQYRYTFKMVSTPLSFDVVGGDDRINDLRIEVVERPQITEMMLDCEYPAYLARAPQALTVSGAMQLPEGTRLTVRGRTSKDLVRVEMNGLAEPQSISTIDNGSGRRTFAFDIPPVESDVVLLFELEDVDGISTLEPYRLVLRMTADEPPLLAVRLRGIGTAVTPGAKIPITGKITDDYALDGAWFEYQIGDAPSRKVAFEPQPGGLETIRADQVLDTRTFADEDRLQPKQQLSIAVQASDRYDLGDTPHVGTSPRFLLDVVSPEQLRILLQRRELLLRQRFEATYANTTEMRDLMARIEFPQPASEGTADTDSAPDEPAVDDDRTESDTAIVEPGDTPAASREESVERSAARRMMRIMHALQSVERAEHETLGVAAGIDDIYDELVNNRLDTVELKTRLKEGIALPLRQLGEGSLTRLKQQVRQLESAAESAAEGSAALSEAVAKADEVLVEMQQILDKMLELESYNEVLELLRGILEDQEELNERTKQLRRQRFLEE